MRAAPADIAQLRLASQRLVGSRPGSPGAAVSGLLALQAQNLPAGMTSVALRTAPGSQSAVSAVSAVSAALNNGAVVRCWCVRGTLHLVHVDDVGWMRDLLGDRALRATAPRLRQLDIDDATTERAADAAVEALTGGRKLSRQQLFRLWDNAGVSPEGQRGVHLLRTLSLRRVVTLGPLVGREQGVVLASEWLPARSPVDPTDALAELASRYYRGHGPATVADLARWAGLTLTQARQGTEAVRTDLMTMDVADNQYLLDPAVPGRLADAKAEADGVLLLPAFDEFLLGYRDRSAVLDPLDADRVTPGGNGLFKPVVLLGGRVVATWARSRGNQVVVAPFPTLGAKARAAIEAAAAAAINEKFVAT